MAVVGAGLAFAANSISPRGLALGRNYFPSGAYHLTRETVATNAGLTAGDLYALSRPAANAANEDSVAARLKSKGLTDIDREEAQKLAGDPQVVFIDARSEEKFEEGHIAGAYELDPYHPERQMGTALAACQAAEKVVVYCEGGECEDADAVAILLRDGGVPAEKVFVYGGGMGDWRTHHNAMEKGARP